MFTEYILHCRFFDVVKIVKQFWRFFFFFFNSYSKRSSIFILYYADTQQSKLISISELSSRNARQYSLKTRKTEKIVVYFVALRVNGIFNLNLAEHG